MFLACQILSIIYINNVDFVWFGVGESDKVCVGEEGGVYCVDNALKGSNRTSWGEMDITVILHIVKTRQHCKAVAGCHNSHQYFTVSVCLYICLFVSYAMPQLSR